MVVLRNRKNTQEHQVAFAEAKAKAQAQAKAEAEAKLQAEAEAKTDKIQEWLAACAKIQEMWDASAKAEARAKAEAQQVEEQNNTLTELRARLNAIWSLNEQITKQELQEQPDCCACEVDDKWADEKWYAFHAASGECHAYKPWI